MSGSLKKEQVDEIISLLDIDDEEYALNVNEFARVCGLAERLFYCQNMYVPNMYAGSYFFRMILII